MANFAQVGEADVAPMKTECTDTRFKLRFNKYRTYRQRCVHV